MANDSPSTDFITNRRKVMASLGALGASALAGCGGSSGGGESSSGGSSSQSSGSGSSGGTLEVLHGWTGGDGSNAITALKQEFKNTHPDVKTNIKAVGGSANVSLNATVTRRLVNNNPMSSFANWPGKNLQRYEGALMDLEEDVWDANGLKDKIFGPAVEKCEFNGIMPAVPIGSHRLNNLFYNVHVFEEAGVNAEDLTDVSSLVDALDKIQKNTDAVGMAQAMKAPFTNLQLFTEILMGQAGVESYMDFINGNPNRSDVADALETEKTILTNYINSDSSSINYTTANSKVMSGNAGCIHEGNWMYGMYRADESFKYKEDWDWIPFPGTKGLYVFHLDSFIAPANNPSPDATKTWEKFVGSKEAQVTFNNPKGSVPPRNDVDPEKLTPFLKMTYKDLLSADQLPPTTAHGLAVSPETLGALKSAFGSDFMGPYHVDKTADALVSAVSS